MYFYFYISLFLNIFSEVKVQQTFIQITVKSATNYNEMSIHQAQNRHIDNTINHYRGIEEKKASENSSRDSNPRPCPPSDEICGSTCKETLLASVFRHLQRPGVVAQQQDRQGPLTRSPFSGTSVATGPARPLNPSTKRHPTAWITDCATSPGQSV